MKNTECEMTRHAIMRVAFFLDPSVKKPFMTIKGINGFFTEE
jgi:hypothetical protein